MANARIRLALDGVQGVINGLGQVGDRINRVSGSLSTLSVLGIGVGIASLGKFTTELYAAAAAAENLRLTFKFSFGESAGKDLNYVKALANDLGLELASTATAYGKLAAAARGTSLEGDGTRAIFESITKASAVMGLSAEQSSGALNALQQMISKGTVASEELRGQLGERLPGAFQIAARAMGVTTQELGKMLEQGEVIADDFLPKFAAQLNSEIGGAAEDAADRLDAATNRMTNSLKRLTTVIAESGIATFFKDLMKSGANDVNAISEAMERAKNRGAGTLGQLNAGAGMFIGKALALNTFTDQAKTLDQQLASTVKRIADLQAHIESTGKASIYTRSDMASLQKTLAQLTAEQQNRDKANTVNPQDARLKAMGKAREAQIKAEKQSTADLAAIRQKLSGVDASYLPTLEKLQALRASGSVGEKEYISLVSELASKNHKKTESNKAAASAIQKEASAYTVLITSIGEKLAAGKLEISGYDQLSESQKLTIKLDSEIASGKNKLSPASVANVRAMIEEVAAQDRAIASGKQLIADMEARNAARGAEEASIDSYMQSQQEGYAAAVTGSKDALKSAQAEYDQFGMKKSQIAEITLLTLQSTKAKYLDGSAGAIATQQQIDAQKELIGLLKQADTKQSGTDQSKRLGVDIPGEFGKIEDPFKDFGSTLRATFDSAGDGLQKMADAMGNLASSGKNYEKEMQVINDLRATKDPGNMATALKNEQKLIEKTKDDQINAYANMAGAAKGYFDEKSDAYRLLNGLEMAMHAFQMANMAEKLFTSLFVSTATATGVVAGQAIETGAVIAGQVTQNAAKVPGVFMSFMSALGPWGAAAAAVAIAAVLGGGGGGGAPTISMDAFAAQKANDGSGGVLGDKSAQSESIQNSLSALEGFAKPSLLFTSQMVTLLRSINTNLSGATNSLLQSGFDAFGSDFKGSSKSSGGGIIGAIFGSSSSSSSLSDLGLAFANQTIAAAMQSIELKKYQVTRTDKSSSGFLGFGSSSSTSYNTQMSAVDDKVARSMTLATQQMFALVEKAAGQIGASQAQIDALKNIDTGLGKVSLNGKTGQEIEELLTAVFSKMGDAMATVIAPGVADMQKAGEGYLETLVRVTNGLSITNTWSRIFGRSLLDVSIQGAKAANQLADAFGDLETLNESSQAFYESYYTQAEQAANSQLAVSEALAAVNLSMPQTKRGLRDLANSLDLSTESGRTAYATLLSLAPEFADTADLIQELAKDASEKLMEAFTGRGQLMPALDTTSLKTLLLKDTLVSTYTAAGNISTLFLNVNSGLITFGTRTTALTGGLTGAQLAADSLQREIVDLGIGASGTVIDIAGLSSALANVNTETFVATIGLVFEALAERIGGVIGDIGAERIAVREAALQIINPTVMSKYAIQRGIGGIDTTLPSNAGITAATSKLAAADSTAAATATAQKQWEGWLAEVQARTTATKLAHATLVTYSSPEEVAAYQRAVAIATSASAAAIQAQSVAANALKASITGYAAAIQNFAIDASKSVSKLSKLREETVKYYEAQKQLADLMGSSAAGLRGTVADYRYSQLSDAQQFDKLQSSYAQAYAMALSTNGETLAGYGNTLNSALNPLLEKAKSVLSDTAYNSFAATALARAETIAGRLELLTPTNYAADSLTMLGQIDSTLAVLDASSRSAEKIISDAVNAGSDKTAAGLHAVIAALTGQAIPGFASGGYHAGGLRIVGENGPELEATGPSRIFNAAQTRSMMGGGNNNAEMIAELRALRQEVANLRTEARATASNTGKLARQGDRNEIDGILVRTDADTPLNTVAA